MRKLHLYLFDPWPPRIFFMSCWNVGLCNFYRSPTTWKQNNYCIIYFNESNSIQFLFVISFTNILFTIFLWMLKTNYLSINYLRVNFI